MLLGSYIKGFVKVGSLTLIDHKGNKTTYAGKPGPSIIIKFHSKALSRKIFFSPNIAIGEAYMNGDLTIENGSIYDFLSFCSDNLKTSHPGPFLNFVDKVALLRTFFHAQNPIKRSRQNVAHHYDISEKLYRLFLDPDMQYSCAYFKTLDDTLEQAQQQKKLHLAAKLRLEPGQKILDIGCGWGGLALTLAQLEDVEVTGLTLSEEQHRVATQRAKEAGLENRVKFLLRDYRQEKVNYDRIVSVGMFEHVGVKHYGDFFNQVSSLLKPDGLAVLHSIGCSIGPSIPNPWLNKYIFPGGYCPSLSETLEALEPRGLYITDIEVMYQHYAETLRCWYEQFTENKDQVIKDWGERFYRMWEFYLVSCELAFRKRGYMVFQIQMVKDIEHAPLTRDYIQDYEQHFTAPEITRSSKQQSR